MDRDWEQALGRVLAEQERRPFGDAEFVSSRTFQRFSFAGQEAATNLLKMGDRVMSVLAVCREYRVAFPPLR